MQSCSHPCGFRICRVEVHCVKMETADAAQFSLSGARLWLLPPELQTKQNKGNHKGSKGVAGTGLVDAVTLDRGRLQSSLFCLLKVNKGTVPKGGTPAVCPLCRKCSVSIPVTLQVATGACSLWTVS